MYWGSVVKWSVIGVVWVVNCVDCCVCLFSTGVACIVWVALSCCELHWSCCSDLEQLLWPLARGWVKTLCSRTPSLQELLAKLTIQLVPRNISKCVRVMWEIVHHQFSVPPTVNSGACFIGTFLNILLNWKWSGRSSSHIISSAFGAPISFSLKDIFVHKSKKL